MENVTMENEIMANITYDKCYYGKCIIVNETEPHTRAHWWKVGTTQVSVSTI